MDPDYARQYAELYRSHWWWRAREAFILARLRTLRPAGGWNRILDVGCGDGLTLDRLSEFGREVEGLEADRAIVSPESLRKYRIHAGVLDARFVPGEPYDLITMLDVLEHIEHPVRALERCREILSPDGSLLITVPAFRLLWTHHDEVNRHFTRYTRRSLTRELHQAGFDCTHSGYFFHWLVPLKLGLRLYERMTRARSGQTAIPPPAVNRALQGVSRLEQSTLSRLRAIPGSSLLAVARRR